MSALRFRAARLAVLLTLTASVAAPARVASAQSLSLRVTPNPAAAGGQLTITLSDARPGRMYVFTGWPLCVQGFGGGLLGRRPANRQGIVRFQYPSPTSPEAICRWRLRAAPVGPGAAVSTILTVRSSDPTVNTAALRGQGGLAFAWGDSTYAVSGTGGPVHLIATSAPSDLAWSADGRWLAYIQIDPTTYTGTALWVARAAGGDAHKVPGLTAIGNFAWAPRGERLAITAAPAGHPNANSSVWLASPTTAPRLLLSGAGGSAWSPDGRQLALETRRPSKSGTGVGSTLVTISVDGGPLTTHAAVQGSGIILAGWWPNGKGLLYMVDPYFSGSIAADGLPLYSVPLHGASKLLTTTLGFKEWLSWAPHGTQFLVVAGAGREIWTGKSLRLCDAAAGTCRILPTPKGRVALDPAWSPDGTRIAYVSARDAGDVGGFGSARANAAWVRTRVLWIADPTGAHAHALPSAGSGIYQPVWSRDSRSLFYVRDNTLWRVGAGGGIPEEVVGPFPTPPQLYPYGY
ncbi:MAG TPA: hypothetical protein VN837_20845, partial [Chloroflexota bacterium]|nr:hypothetical protein [Chloroflexota bacterium]